MFLRAGVFSGVFAVASWRTAERSRPTGSVTATSGDTFSPAAVTINQGESVTWTNGGGNHNVVLADGDVALNSPSTSGWTVTSHVQLGRHVQLLLRDPSRRSA